ncbi:hypothetical protein CLAFUW4_10721 [Fulvia fulva]|nr:hypothetical protein CLAFUR4_10726 [Fulvia fulva]WPV19735.1 hypothetical protein CLAFUW4_10721 [Fulvia fulva]WPV33817.1 hypothetical protein CLAFUW7_10723 [Fulvia fulva]
MLSSCRSVYPRIPGEHEIFLDTTGTETDPEHLEQFTAAQITHAYPRQMKLEAVFRVQDSCQGNQVGLCDNYWRPATTLLDADAAEMPLNTYFEHMLWMIWASIQRLSGVEKDFESRKLAKAFFGVDLPEPEPTEQEPCPEAKLVAGTVGTSRWQFAAAMSREVFKLLYKPKPEAQECAKPRDLCGSDWLEYLSMHSQVNEDGAEAIRYVEAAQHGLNQTDFAEEYWWFQTDIDGEKRYVRLFKMQFPSGPPPDEEPPFKKNPQRNDQLDPCCQNPKGGFTVWLDNRAYLTLCPDSFERFPSDRPNLQVAEGDTNKHVANPASKDEDLDIAFAIIAVERQVPRTLEQVAVNALTWYRELFRMVGSRDGMERLTYFPIAIAKAKPETLPESWWEDRSNWLRAPRIVASSVYTCLSLALLDRAPVQGASKQQHHATHNVDNYAWYGLAAYLSGEKDWSTGVERPAGQPYRPHVAPPESDLGPPARGSTIVESEDEGVVEDDGKKRKHGEGEDSGGDDVSGGKKQKTTGSA